MVRRIKSKRTRVLKSEEEKDFVDVVSTSSIFTIIITQILRVVTSFFMMEILKKWWTNRKKAEDVNPE